MARITKINVKRRSPKKIGDFRNPIAVAKTPFFSSTGASCLTTTADDTIFVNRIKINKM